MASAISTKKWGPWAVVTGASDGIGREFAKCLAEAGFNLVVVARRQERLEALSRELNAHYRVETLPIKADLSEQSGLQEVAEKTDALDVGLFVASAGFGTSGCLVDSEIDKELNMVDVNCRAVTAQTHHFARRFKAQKRGGIVLLSSIVAFQGVPRSAHYAATKAYIQSLAEGLRAELKPFNVDVIACAPGPVASGFAKRANMKMDGAQAPEKIAQTTLATLGKKTTVRPGPLSKLLGYSLSLLPRWGRIQIMTLVMQGMTKHQQPG